MTDRAEKKDVIKKHVRSLLLSSPIPLTVDELKRDFHSFIGERLDVRPLGYTKLEDFLRDANDAVEVGWKNGFMTLSAKADSATKHIQKLVSKQKIPNKKKYAVYKQKRPNTFPPRQYQPNNRRYNTYNTPRQPVYSAPKPFLPAYIREQMGSLVRNYPDGFPLTHLNAVFSRCYGTNLNHSKYGFESLEDFVGALHEIVILKVFANGEKRVLPVGYSHALPQSSSQQSSSHPSSSPPSSSQPESSQRPSRGRGRRKESGHESDGQEVRPGSRVETDNVKSGTNQQAEEVGQRLERELREVIQRKPKGVWASRLPYEYAEVHCKALDFREHGFLSVIELLAAMPATVRIERPNPQGDWMVYDARLPKEEREETARPRRLSGQTLSPETKSAIQRVLHSRPSGILAWEFPDVFKRSTGYSLPLKELGFNGPEALALSLADTVLQISYSRSDGSILLFSMDVELPSAADSQEEPDLPVSPGPVQDCLPDVVGPGCHYVPVMSPDVGLYFGLYVSNIVNAGLFWVMLRHKSKSLALERLMDDIDEVYRGSKSERYKMPENLMVRGQVCATLFPEDNNWHRGVINKVNDNGFVEVYYVDYGNTTSVPKNTVCFLKSEFLALPAQAVQSRLANIHPPSGKWTVKSRNRMLELCKQRRLVGYVYEVKAGVLSLCLTDTCDPSIDIHINDVLVQEEHAIFLPDDQVALAGTQQLVQTVDYDHVFGWAQPNAKGDSGELAQPEEENTTQSCYVKWVQLTQDHILHLVNLSGEPYAISAEVSNLIWDEDILTSMLNQRRVEVSKLVVSSDEYPQLFQELTRYKVRSLKAEMLAKKQFITLYAVSSIPTILGVFAPQKAELISAIEELSTKFDPNSPYWKSITEGEGSPKESSGGQPQEDDIGEEDLLTYQLTRDEKEVALQTLVMKRKRLLQALFSESSATPEKVNELNNYEIEITILRQELDEMEPKVRHLSGSKVRYPSGSNMAGIQSTVPAGSGTVNRDARPSGPGEGSSQGPVSPVSPGTPYNTDRFAENQQAIRNIMASTTKPIATANRMTKAATSMPVSGASVSVSQSCQYTSPNQSNTQNQPANLSTTGIYPGMMGINPGFPAQQRFMNPMLMAQAGMMPMANFPMGPGMIPNFNPALMQDFNPLLMQHLGTTPVGSAMVHPGVMPGVNPMVRLPGLGRGQPVAASSSGLLPGLMPLVQNLSLGRGGRGAGAPNK